MASAAGRDGPEIFVSHSADAEPALGLLSAALASAGYISSGADWAAAPSNALRNVQEQVRRAEGGVVVVTQEALESEFIRQEATFLQQRAVEDPSFQLVPLLAEGITVTNIVSSPIAFLTEFPMASGVTLGERVEATIEAFRGSRPVDLQRGEPPDTGELSHTGEPPDTASQMHLARAISNGSPVSAVALRQRDGESLLATADERGVVRTWDITTGEERGQPLSGHELAVWSVAFAETSRGPAILSGGQDMTVRVHDLETRRLRDQVLVGHTAPVNAVAAGRTDETALAVSASDDQTLCIWDIDAMQLLQTLTGHEDWVNAVALEQLADGTLVAVSGSSDLTVRVWSLQTGENLRTLTGHTASVSSIATGRLPDGRTAAVSGSLDGTVRMWDIDTGSPLAVFNGGEAGVRAVAVSSTPLRASAVSGDNDGALRMWDFASGSVSEPTVSVAHAGPVRALATSTTDTPLVISGGEDGIVNVWSRGAILPESHVNWITDAPAAHDSLRRRPLARALHARILRLRVDDPGTSFLVHIDGAWGTGKTSLVKFLCEELEKKDLDDTGVDTSSLVVHFDAWRQSRVGPAWWALLSNLRRTVTQDRGFFGRAIFRLAESWARLRRSGSFILSLVLLLSVTIAVFLLLRPVKVTAETTRDLAQSVTAIVTAVGTLMAGIVVARRFLLWDSARGARLLEQSTAHPMEDISRQFAWLLDRAQRPVVFVIDDLDRCPDAYVVEVLDAVQTLIRDGTQAAPSVGSQPPTAPSFIVAADGAWLRKSYEIAYASFVDSVAEPGRPLGYLFLDKLFQLRVPVPVVDEFRQRAYLRELLGVTSPPEVELAGVSEREARDRLQASETETEVIDTLRGVSGAVRERVAGAAVERLSAPKIAAATEHTLEDFAVLLEPNPRSMKRFLNNYGAARAVRTLEGNVVGVGPLALWTIIETRWPSFADYVREDAARIELVGASNGLEDVPPDLRPLFGNSAVRATLDFPQGGPLTAKLIRECCGADVE